MSEIEYSRYTVMIVDDVPLNILLINKMLNRFPFKAILSAGNGQKALEMLENEHVDIVLLDLMMPVMDGFEVLRRIRANEALSNTKVVIVSALNSDADVAKGFELKANDFLTKPIIMDRLCKSINTQIEAIESNV